MTKQDISVLGKEDAFKLIGKEWMLVTAGTEDMKAFIQNESHSLINNHV